MSRPTPSLEALNAYVDGELSARDASTVAKAISQSPDLAQKVAVLSKLKAAVQEGVDEPAPSLPQTKGGGAASRLPALAAAACFLLFIGATALMHLMHQPSAPAWLESAWGLHRDWLAQPASSEPREAVEASVILAGFVGLGPDIVIPDLKAARLRLSFARKIDLASDLQGLHLGYRGTRGCQISLFLIDQGVALGSDLKSFGQSAELVRGWRIGNRAHVLLAEGMDPARFALIAESIYQATREAAPFDAETRTALARSRAESRPCLS